MIWKPPLVGSGLDIEYFVGMRISGVLSMITIKHLIFVAVVLSVVGRIVGYLQYKLSIMYSMLSVAKEQELTCVTLKNS